MPIAEVGDWELEPGRRIDYLLIDAQTTGPHCTPPAVGACSTELSTASGPATISASPPISRQPHRAVAESRDRSGRGPPSTFEVIVAAIAQQLRAPNGSSS
jgi:hypothetical protein